MTDVAITDSEVFKRFLAAADTEAHELDPDEVSMEIIGKILAANTVDDILGGQGATHARDFLNVPFTLTGVKFNRSDMDTAGPSFYGLLSGADQNGEPVTITCGARNVIAQAWKLREIDALPVDVELRESDRPTANGFKVMWLAKAGSSF